MSVRHLSRSSGLGCLSSAASVRICVAGLRGRRSDYVCRYNGGGVRSLSAWTGSPPVTGSTPAEVKHDTLVRDEPVGNHGIGDENMAIEKVISSLPLIRYLRSQAPPQDQGLKPDSFKEFRLHSNMEPSISSAHLVIGSLYGPSKLPIHPRLFIQASPRCRIIAVGYIGSRLCGHPGYVHGGMLFSLFDDIFARCAAMLLPTGVGMTANLNIDFRKPSIPDRLYIIRAEVLKHEGRKVWVNGLIRCLPPAGTDAYNQLESSTTVDDLSVEEKDADLVAEATALFIEPKFANTIAPLFRSH